MATLPFLHVRNLRLGSRGSSCCSICDKLAPKRTRSPSTVLSVPAVRVSAGMYESLLQKPWNSGSWRHAQAMLMSMVDQRIPDQIGFNACLSTYAAAGLWALSLQLLNTMSCCRFAPETRLSTTNLFDLIPSVAIWTICWLPNMTELPGCFLTELRHQRLQR